jgi:hypothetical protein
MAELNKHPKFGNGQWREINDSPEFAAWLNQPEPFSGNPRKALLGDAYNRGDASRTARFFESFVNEHTAVAPAPPAPSPIPLEDPGAGRVSLESLAAPGRATGTVPGGAPVEKRIWTGAEIIAFYRDVTRGKYVGNEALKTRLDADIVAAATEGRIRS